METNSLISFVIVCVGPGNNELLNEFVWECTEMEITNWLEKPKGPKRQPQLFI